MSFSTSYLTILTYTFQERLIRPNNHQTSTDIRHASTAAFIVTDLFHNSITGQIDNSDMIIPFSVLICPVKAVSSSDVGRKIAELKGYGNIISTLLFTITGKNL